MLIWIDASVLGADLAADPDACCGVSGIFDAVYRGEHYALGERSTLRALGSNPNLSPLTKRIIATVIENLPTLGGISQRVTSRINVTHGKATACKRINPSIWEIPLKDLGLHGVKKAVLLTENLDDARAFEHAARQYQVYAGMPGQIALEKSGGGGSTTPGMFVNFTKSEQRWCLCVTDSDRLHPTANIDHTAKKCKQIAEDNSIVAAHTDLSAREIENILPIVFLAEVIPPTHQEQWDWHINRLNKLRPDIHNYCDIKRGTTLRKIRSYPDNSPTRIYWEKVAKDLEKAAALVADCFSLDECKQADEAPCQCYVGYGFGEKVLELVVGNLDCRTAQQSEKMTRQDPNRGGWMDVGCTVFEWCCAPRKTRL